MPQRYYTTVSRYVDGKYIHADPDHPTLVEFPDHIKIDPKDRTLTKASGEPPKVEKPRPPYADVRRGPPGVPGRRPSDVDPD